MLPPFHWPTYSFIHQGLGRDHVSVSGQIQKLHKAGKIGASTLQKWTEEDKKTVFKMIDEGKTHRKIADD